MAPLSKCGWDWFSLSLTNSCIINWDRVSARAGAEFHSMCSLLVRQSPLWQNDTPVTGGQGNSVPRCFMLWLFFCFFSLHFWLWFFFSYLVFHQIFLWPYNFQCLTPSDSNCFFAVAMLEPDIMTSSMATTFNNQEWPCWNSTSLQATQNLSFQCFDCFLLTNLIGQFITSDNYR